MHNENDIVPPGENPEPLPINRETLEENLEAFWRLLRDYDSVLRIEGRCRDVDGDGEYIL